MRTLILLMLLLGLTVPVFASKEEWIKKGDMYMERADRATFYSTKSDYATVAIACYLRAEVDERKHL